MPTEEEERRAKAERAKKLLATRAKKAKAAAAASSTATTPNPSASPALTDIDAGTASARTSLSIDDRTELAPPPKGEARRKKAITQELDGGGDPAGVKGDAFTKTDEEKAGDSTTGGEATVTQEKDTADREDQRKEAVKQEPNGGEQPAEVGGDDVPEKVEDTTEEVVKAARTMTTEIMPTADTQTSSNLQETVSLLIAERADLQSQLAARDAEIASAKADKKLLEEGRAIIEKLESEKGELSARIAALESEADGAKLVQAELSDLRKEADSLRQAVNEAEEALRAEKGKRAAEIEGDKEKVAGLERNLERAREREGVLELEVGRLRQREGELKTTADTRSANADALRKELAAVKEQLDSSSSDHSSLRIQLDTLSADHTSLQSSHTSLFAELESLRATHSSQSDQLSAAQSSLSKIQAELERTTSSLSTERKRAEAAEKKKQALQTENADLVHQLEEVRGKVASVMEEKAELAGELDSARGQIRKVDVDQTVKTLEAELQASTARIHTLTRQLADLQSAYATPQKDSLSSGYIGSPNRLHPDAPPITRTSGVNRTVDAILPANVRHKRQVSLTALKARMGSSFSKGGLDVLTEHPGERRQFGDEIMFCCPACEGDLITL